ncbi:acyltransferase family protein [Aquimarina sp. D1M17]|uniref:acyltransferase family protein n=1 Tax=Aquimarina acroporae TaxID=2937283 RepID=UPI0020C0DEB4|nr:acyltransferase family protein [Aquimarina acroporae]MCK8520914.1 acyltransferase family protein [Aquimarina acroporae]
MKTKIRRYDLDWLRVIVFGLLIFYHVGMFFVPWGWHIKNNHIVEWIRWPMLFLNQWRLPILFVISGMGTYYALSSRNLWQFNLERYIRLGIPLAFGMLLIVPPQVYFERLANHEFTGSYMAFLSGPAYKGIYPDGNISWHHLWFLPYLFLYSLLLSPILIFLKRKKTRFITWVSNLLQKSFGFYLFVIPLYFVEVLIEPFFPVTHALVDDWFTFINYFILFFYGFVLLATGNVFWEQIDRIKKRALWIGCVAFLIQTTIWIIGKDSILIHFTEGMIKVINLWSWILVLFGYAAKYLNRKSSTISYCNRAVYPFYILHQTITITIGYYLMDLHWNTVSKFIIMVLGTFLASWVLYHFVILKIPFLHPLFGLKKGYSSYDKKS